MDNFSEELKNKIKEVDRLLLEFVDGIELDKEKMRAW